MSYQIKLFCQQSSRVCLIIGARGLVDKAAFLQMLHEVVELTKQFDDCKVLLDLQNSKCDFGLDDVEWKIMLMTDLSPAVGKLKLAIVTPQTQQQSGRLPPLMLPVGQLGIQIAVFFEETRAIEWLDITT